MSDSKPPTTDLPPSDPARRWQTSDPARRWQTSDPARRWHDMGGDPAGPVPTDQHDFSLWEKRVDALMILGAGKGYFTVDGLRRVLEDMGEDTFEKLTYYERWIISINQNLIEGGAYTTADLADKMAEITARGETYGDASHAS